MKRRVTLLLLLVSISSSVFAIVLGGTNLGILGYPEHSCKKPNKPMKPYSLDSSWEINSYNIEADSYNMERERYISCMKEYLENAGNDIQRIKENMEAAIDEAKRPSF